MTEQGVEIVVQRTRERFNQSIKVECVRPGTPLSPADARTGPSASDEKPSANRREPSPRPAPDPALDGARAAVHDSCISPDTDSLGRPEQLSNSR